MKSISFRVHFTKLTTNSIKLIKLLVVEINQKEGELEIEGDSQVSVYLRAMHSRVMKEKQVSINKGLKSVERSLLQDVLVDDKTEILLHNMHLSNIEVEDPNAWFFKFTFS